MKTLQGARAKTPTPSELDAQHLKSFRRSVYAARNIRAGEILSEENLTILRPEHGVSACRFGEVLGRKAARDIGEHEVFKDRDFS